LGRGKKTLTGAKEPQRQLVRGGGSKINWKGGGGENNIKQRTEGESVPSDSKGGTLPDPRKGVFSKLGGGKQKKEKAPERMKKDYWQGKESAHRQAGSWKKGGRIRGRGKGKCVPHAKRKAVIKRERYHGFVEKKKEKRTHRKKGG